MTGEFEYVLSEGDYVGFVVRHALRRLLFVAPIVIACLLVQLLIFYGDSDPVSAVFLAAVLFAAIGLSIFLTISRATRIYRQTPSMKQLRSVRFDENGLIIEQDSGLSRHSWSEFNRWDINARLLGLWLNDAAIFLFPRKSISNHNIQGIADNMKRSGLLPKKRRKRA